MELPPTPGAEDAPPFVLVIDRVAAGEAGHLSTAPLNAGDALAIKGVTGARGVLVFHEEVQLPGDVSTS